MSEANAKQIGGEHYRSMYQHWDFAIDNQLPYLIGCATKYVTRAYKKDGHQDLEKAVHYIEKLGESFLQKRESSQEASVAAGIVEERLIEKFIELNALDELQAGAIRLLCTWEDINDLARARQIIIELRDSLPK